jgi:AraC family transcriptional regulator
MNGQQNHVRRPGTVESHFAAVERVINNLRKRLDEKISLKEMAAVAYMSPFHFDRTFREVTGISPFRFLSALRFETAMRKLIETDNSVTDICFDLGYRSLGTFIWKFSEVLGVSPRRLRVLRRSTANDLLHRQVLDREHKNGDGRPYVHGSVHAPSGFSGPIFVGLFPAPIPEGTPVACAVKFRPGSFVIANVPTGEYHVYVMGLPWPDHVHDYFRYESALRAGGATVAVANEPVDCGEICLRSALPTDTPILLNLPLLLEKVADLCQGECFPRLRRSPVQIRP